MKNIFPIFIIICLVLFSQAAAQSTSIVQGQIFTMDEYDLTPATSCIINLYPKGSDEILSTAKPGRNGIFSFNRVVPGDYTIKVLPLGTQQSLQIWRVFDLHIGDVPVVNIKPILLNRYDFSFKKPAVPLLLDISQTKSIAPEGTISGLPPNAKIWLFLKTAAGYRIACTKSITIRNMKKWFCPQIKTDNPFSEIIAVLVPEKIHQEYKTLMTTIPFLDLNSLPKNSVQIGKIPVDAR